MCPVGYVTAVLRCFVLVLFWPFGTGNFIFVRVVNTGVSSEIWVFFFFKEHGLKSFVV